MTKNTDNELLMFEAVCKCLGYHSALVRYWEKTNPKKFDELILASEMLASVEIPIDQLDRAYDEWKNDWRGQKGQKPTPAQFAELAAMYHEQWTNQQKELDSLNKAVPWYIQKGLSIEELDEILWNVESERDPRWGEYCT